jgi:hypothetical protein
MVLETSFKDLLLYERIYFFILKYLKCPNYSKNKENATINLVD